MKCFNRWQAATEATVTLTCECLRQQSEKRNRGFVRLLKLVFEGSRCHRIGPKQVHKNNRFSVYPPNLLTGHGHLRLSDDGQ